MTKDYIEFQTPYSKSNKVCRLIWNIVWACLARPFPRSMAMGWKRTLLRTFGAKITSTSVVYATAKVFQPWLLTMDDYACLAEGVNCYNAAPIIIGINATVSQGAYLCTASHNISSSRHEQIEKPIIIGDRAWVAAQAFIGPGVTIGEGAVVGARAVVFKNVDSWTVVGGNPARFIKKRIIKNE